MLNHGKELVRVTTEYHILKETQDIYAVLGEEFYVSVECNPSYKTKVYELKYDLGKMVYGYEDRANFSFDMMNNRYNTNFSSNVKIHLPNKIKDIGDVHVWVTKGVMIDGYEHNYKDTYYTDNEDVKINYIDNQIIEFSYSGGTPLCDVRVLLPANIFSDNIIKKYVETAQEINEIENSKPILNEYIEKKVQKSRNSRLIIFILVYMFFWYIPFKLLFNKKMKMYDSLEKKMQRGKYEYYRNLDDVNTSPLKAWMLTNNEFYKIPSKDFENILTSTIFYLELNGNLKFNKKENETEIVLLNESTSNLEFPEIIIFDFIKEIINKKGSYNSENLLYIRKSEVQKYIKRHKFKIIALRKNVEKVIIKQLEKEELLKKDDVYSYIKLNNFYNEKYEEVEGFHFLVYIWAFAVNFPLLCFSDFYGILSIIISVFMIKRYLLSTKKMRKIELLNEKGIELSEKLHGLKRYLKDYSIIKDREMIEIKLWEEYLMYATVFGIAKKTIKQMDLDYPDYESFFVLRY